MSKNVVLWDGTVVTISDEQAARLEDARLGREESGSEASARGATEALERSTTTGDKARAFVEGGLDTLSGGAYGKAVEYLADDNARFDMQRSAQVAPGYRIAGEIGGALLPTGLLGGAAREATAFSVPGVAARAGEGVAGAAGKTVGRVIEGGLQGAGGYVAHTNVTGDPLSVEGLVEGAGIGGVFNVGAGLLADKIASSARKAQAAVGEAEDFVKKAEIAEANAKHFETDAGVNTAYKNFTTAVKVRQSAAQKTYREWEKQATNYTKFVNDDHAFAEAVEDAQNVIRSVKARPGFYEDTPVADRLRSYNQRISDIWRMRGGKNKLGTKTWEKDPSIARDVEGSMTELRRLYTDMLDGQSGFPKEAGLGLRKATTLPAHPGRPPVLPPKVELARDFKSFTRQHPETVDKILAQMDDATAAEFEKVAAELGVAPVSRTDADYEGIYAKAPRQVQEDWAAILRNSQKEDPQITKQKIDDLLARSGFGPAGDTIRAVHRQASGWLKAIDDLESKAAQETVERSQGKGFFELARRFARNAIRFKAGFGVSHAVGGPVGSAMGVAASAVVGGAIDRMDDALVGGSLLTAKTAAKSRVSSVVAKYGGRVAHGVQELGPVTSYLATSHLMGRQDSEPNFRMQARNRIDEVQGAMLTGPDTVYAAVQPLLGHGSDAAYKVHAHVMNALAHLAEVAPKDPGIDVKMFQSKWTPSWHESIEYAHRLEATFNPVSALARLLNGTGSPAAADTMWRVWPAMMQQAAQEIILKAAEGEYSTPRASAFSRIFRTPITGMQHPVVVTALQGQYMTAPVAEPQGQAGQPTGRPPAIQSPVAGSNVASLIA